MRSRRVAAAKAVYREERRRVQRETDRRANANKKPLFIITLLCHVKTASTTVSLAR